MNRGHVLQSTPVQQMMGGNPNWWSINANMRPPPPNPSSSLLPPPPPPSTLFPSHYAPPPSSWQDNNENHQQLPDSWSQLLLGGLVGDQEEQMLQLHQASSNIGTTTPTTTTTNSTELVKQENSSSSGGTTSFAYGTTSNWSQMMGGAAAASSPKSSCISSSTISTNILDFSSNKSNACRHPPPDHSSECNSTATGGTPKKARVQPSSTSTFKVRKEKLGDRITALHQLVSPFGKTDTASVLLEAIGYIRFLQSQIEALSLPYLGSGSANTRHRHSAAVQGERNCLFPEDPGQLLNDSCMKRKGAPDHQDSNGEAKDLRSRGLCLVPLSCTLQVGSDNGADYWAPALGGGGFR